MFDHCDPYSQFSNHICVFVDNIQIVHLDVYKCNT